MSRQARSPLQDPDALSWTRHSLGLSLRTCAQLAGISPGYLHDLESGRRSATPETLARLAKAMRCPIRMLEGREP